MIQIGRVFTNRLNRIFKTIEKQSLHLRSAIQPVFDIRNETYSEVITYSHSFAAENYVNIAEARSYYDADVDAAPFTKILDQLEFVQIDAVLAAFTNTQAAAVNYDVALDISFLDPGANYALFPLISEAVPAGDKLSYGFQGPLKLGTRWNPLNPTWTPKKFVLTGRSSSYLAADSLTVVLFLTYKLRGDNIDFKIPT